MVTPPDDVWEKSAEIQYWWRVRSGCYFWLVARNLLQPIRSTFQIHVWVVARHQYKISSFVPQTSFRLSDDISVSSQNVVCFALGTRLFCFPGYSASNDESWAPKVKKSTFFLHRRCFVQSSGYGENCQNLDRFRLRFFHQRITEIIDTV